MSEGTFHCTSCGGAHTDTDWPKKCPGCGRIAYRNPIPVAVVLLPVRTASGLGLLTIRRDIEPKKGELALPGGYVDFKETWEEGAARELREETQIEVDPASIKLFDVHSPSDAAVVLIFAEAPEVDEADLPAFEGSFETSERPVVMEATDLAFPNHTLAMRAWFAGGPRAATVDAVLTTRRTIHLYRPDPIPAGALDAALAAAVCAPNHKHTHPWRFTVVGRETRAAVADVAVACKRATREQSAEQEAITRAKILGSAEMVVLRQVLDADAGVREEDYASVACAAQNLMLSLHARGISSKWTTGAVTRHDDTYALLGVDRSVERICGFVWVGYSAQVPNPSTPAVEDFVTRLP